MPIDEQTIAEDRVRRYLDIRDRVKMINLSDVVHAVHSGTEHEAELRLSDVRALLIAASNEARLQREVEALRADQKWEPTHRHLKRGSSYQVIGSAVLQTAEPIHDAHAMTVYVSENGALWVRPTTEFNDDRFEQIAPPAASEEDAS